MSFNDLLRNLSRIGIKSRISDVPIERDKKIIDSFAEPKDDIERSYVQYKCQMKYYKALFFFLGNLAAGIILPFWTARMRKKSSNFLPESADAVFHGQGKSPSLIANDLFEKYGNIQTSPMTEPRLEAGDTAFIRKVLKRYPCSWLFAFKIAIKLSECRGIISVYAPKAIIACNEFSYTSSAVTGYLEENDIKYINVMHGEKLFDIRDSFFRFSACYVWDRHYVELFGKLRAAEGQFVVAVPQALTIEIPKMCEKSIDYTYYLGEETGNQLSVVAQNMKVLLEKGFKVAVRPHPRYSKLDEVRSVFVDFVIETKDEIGIEESVRRTANVVSKYSTVLFQAYNSGVDAVIDDISDAGVYNGLKERGYIMLSKEHILLSDLIGEK